MRQCASLVSGELERVMTAYGFGMYGWLGRFADPGEDQFSHRVGTELGVNVGASPYQESDVNNIVAAILALPPEVPVIVWGTSLGANNAPVVASRVHAQNPNRIIHGIWGFQASEYGANEGIPVNVLFARLTSSDNPIPFPHLGSYRWVKVHGNTVTNFHLDTVNDPHPGDGNVAVQNKYLADMRRVIAAVGQA
jgi:hypothetical protein